MLSPKKRLATINKIFSLRSRRWTYDRPLVEKEKAEIARLTKTLDPQFSCEQKELFSRVITEHGGTVLGVYDGQNFLSQSETIMNTEIKNVEYLLEQIAIAAQAIKHALATKSYENEQGMKTYCERIPLIFSKS